MRFSLIIIISFHIKFMTHTASDNQSLVCNMIITKNETVIFMLLIFMIMIFAHSLKMDYLLSYQLVDDTLFT